MRLQIAKKTTQWMSLVFAVILFSYCAGSPKAEKKAKESQTVSVMTYNVENLFDTKDDPDKTDETYLPKKEKTSELFKAKCRQLPVERWKEECLHLDWSQSLLDRKLSRLTKVIRQVNEGRGPDILILQEVENIDVLKYWNTKYLSDLGYQTIALIEGPDERGIDNAVMSRLVASRPPQLHEFEIKESETVEKKYVRPTRGILQVDLVLSPKAPAALPKEEKQAGEILSVFALHFPAQFSPTPVRFQALERLKEITENLPKDRMIIIGGDFNISVDEEAKHDIFSKTLSKKWEVSHIVGCKDCKGTTYYHRNRAWSFFDVLLFSKNLSAEGTSPWRLKREKIHIPNSVFYQVNRYGSPARFSQGKKSTGVSDHWPMYAELEYSPNKKDVKNVSE